MSKLLPVVLVLMFVACGEEAPDENPDKGVEPPSEPALRGIVVAPDETPVVGARVRVRLPFGAGIRGAREGLSTETNADGEFALFVERDLKPTSDSPPWIEVIADGFVKRDFQLGSFRPGVGQWLQMELERAAAISGRVVDETGAPVAGSFVYVILTSVAGVTKRDEVLNATTAGDGTWRIDGIPEDEFDVVAVADGRISAIAKDVLPVAGEETFVPDISLAPGGTISGRVTTPDGKALAGARVHVHTDARMKEYLLPGRAALAKVGGLARTDEEGRFRVTGLDTGPWTVEATKMGYRTVEAAKAEVRPGTKDVDLVLEEILTVTLAVKNIVNDEPVTHFDVVILELSDLKDIQGRPLREERATVDSPTGKWSFAVRKDAPYGVEIGAEGYEIYRNSMISSGLEPPRVVEVSLTPRR